MKTSKLHQTLILVVILILFVTIYCNIFKPDAKNGAPQGDASEVTSTPKPNVTPTVVPTNLVNLDDSGLPLPPKIVEVIPTGGQSIGSDGTIQVIFSQPMEQNATSAALSLLGPTGELVDGKITWAGDDRLYFKPAKAFPPGNIYQLLISKTATSQSNIGLLDDVSYQIRIAGDLMVSQVFPEDGTVDVESNAVITAIFNRPVVPLMAFEDQHDLVQPLKISPLIEGQGEWLNTSVYVFHPAEALESSTTYSIVIEAGLVDSIGSTLLQSYHWKFTTTAPSISSFGISEPVKVMNPVDNYGDVRLDASFFVNFLQPMDPLSVSDSINFYSQRGDDVQVNIDWITDYQVVISPTQQLALETEYTLLLSENAKSDSGGNLDEGLRWNFRTIPYPGIESTLPEDNSNQSYFSNRFGINFKSPISLDTIDGRVIVTPEPTGELSWYYNSWGWNVDFFGLEPSTDYEVKVLPGIEDIYGNPIIDEYSFKFRTADYASSAYLDLPYAPTIYTLGGPMRFFVSYVNVSSVSVDLFQIPPSYFVGFNNGTYNRWDFTPPEEWLVNNWFWENTKGINEITRRGVHLAGTSEKILEPGFYLITINSPQIHTTGANLDTRLLVVAEANLTFKTTQTESLVWLTDLDTGDPISDVSLMFFDHEFNQIETGSTNSDGLLYKDLPISEEIYRSRYVMTTDGEPFAFAVSDWGSGVSPYDFGIWSSYYTLPDQPIAYVYTDRPLYRPGQTVNFKGILRQNDDLAYSLLPWSSVDVVINSFNETVYQGELTLSEFGSFNGEFVLDENAALGYYSIQIRAKSGDESVGGVGFSVAEYRKPEFQVNAQADPEYVLVGDEFNVDVSAEYYSGGGVSNADVYWAIQAVDYYFQPEGDFNRYNFVDLDRDLGFYNDFYEPPPREIIANGENTTDVNGNLSVPVKADLSESGISRLFTFEVTISDIAGTSVSDRVNIIAHQAAVYPGIRSKRYVGKVGVEQGFELVVVDWDSKPVISALMDVEIVERRWYSVQEQDSQGFSHWTSSVEEITVAEFNNVEMDSRGRATVSFVPENGGVYKAKAVVQDEYGNQAYSGAYTWISSGDHVSWRQTDDRRIELVADKESYLPGDIAEILLASPFAGDNYALVTVERGHIREQDVIRLASNSAVYRLPIRADMAPNVYVSVIVIQGAENGGIPDFRMGMVELAISQQEQVINIEIIADIEQAGPGDEVTYSIITKDHNDRPVSAEVSVALVDLAALSLSEPNSSSILDYFYSKRSLSVRTTVPLVFNIEHYISSLEDRITEGDGMGSGGGKGADVYGVFDIRGDFQDTAFWQAQLVTDESGEAEVTITLPDNLTVWRMDARAVSINTLVGDGEDDLRSTKPLLVRPQTPRFFVVGDQSSIGAAVHNNTDEDLSVDVELEAQGLSIKSQSTQSVEIASGHQAYVTWDVSIDLDTARVDLIIKAVGGTYSDASKPTMGTLDNQGIPVYRFEALETVGTAGMLGESGSRTEGISIPSSVDVTNGNIEIRISPSLVAGMTDGLDYLEHYPYECIEQTISRFLPNVLTQQALGSAGISDPDLLKNIKTQVSIATQRLYNWQHPDGGWGWWPDASQSDPLTSAYVVLGLVEAENAGYFVNADTLTRGENYLKGRLQSLGNLDKQYLLNRQAFILYVLAKADSPQISLTGVMYDSRQSMSLYAKAYLAQALWMIDPNDPRLDTFISDFINSAVLSATGVHWVEEWRDYRNWNTDLRTTSIVLSTLIKIDPENQLNSNAVRWLMTKRINGHWRSTQETAWTLMTLTNWLVATGELSADYDWAVGMNGVRLGDGSANADTVNETQLLTADSSLLFVEEINRLTVARDQGLGNLYYTAHLNAYLPVDKIQPLDRGIAISREYFNPSESDDLPVYLAEQGDILLARLTIVAPADLYYVIVDDPLPAGLETIDQSFETSPEITAPERYDFDAIWQGGWGWWYFDHFELRDERVLISADYLPAGTYVYTYLVRASTPGTYFVIPPTAHEFYFPEVYGRGSGGSFIVEP